MHACTCECIYPDGKVFHVCLNREGGGQCRRVDDGDGGIDAMKVMK